MKYLNKETLKMFIANQWTFGTCLFLVIICGGVLAYPYPSSGLLPAADDNKPIPFIIDNEKKADDGSELICTDGTCESVNQPENQEGDEVSMNPLAKSPFVLRRPLLSSIRLMRNIRVRWCNAWKSRIRWVEIKRGSMR